MVSFGDSKLEPVEPPQCLLNVTPSNLALSAKCTIHDVRGWCLFIIHSLSDCYCFLNLSFEALLFPKKIVFRVGKKSVGKDILIDKFWSCVGFSCDLAMCMALAWAIMVYSF